MPGNRHEGSAIIRADLGDDAPGNCELGIKENCPRQPHRSKKIFQDFHLAISL